MLTENKTAASAIQSTPLELAKEMREHKKTGDEVKVKVLMARTNAEDGMPELIAGYKGVRVIIPYHELDDKIKYGSVVQFVGREIFVVIKKFNAKYNLAEASRAAAQRKQRENVEKKLRDGEIMTARVVNLFDYGGYVSINGITGFIKNSYFSDDATRIIDVLKVGDKIKVKLLSIDENGKMKLEAAEKYKKPDSIDIEVLEAGQIVFGIVKSVKPWGIFVNIARGLDALTCSDLEDETIEENQQVQIKILKVYADEKGNKRIRGVIKRIIR